MEISPRAPCWNFRLFSPFKSAIQSWEKSGLNDLMRHLIRKHLSTLPQKQVFSRTKKRDFNGSLTVVQINERVLECTGWIFLLSILAFLLSFVATPATLHMVISDASPLIGFIHRSRQLSKILRKEMVWPEVRSFPVLKLNLSHIYFCEGDSCKTIWFWYYQTIQARPHKNVRQNILRVSTFRFCTPKPTVHLTLWSNGLKKENQIEDTILLSLWRIHQRVSQDSSSTTCELKRSLWLHCLPIPFWFIFETTKSHF